MHLGSLLRTIQLQTEMRLIKLNPTTNGQFLDKTDPCIWLPTVISQDEQIHFQEKKSVWLVNCSHRGKDSLSITFII